MRRSRSSVSEVVAETSNRKSSNSSRSLKRTFAFPRTAMAVALSGGRLDDLDAGAGADSRGSCGDHFLQVVQGTYAAAGLDAHLRTDDRAHQLNVFHGSARGAEASRCLHEIGLRQL